MRKRCLGSKSRSDSSRVQTHACRSRWCGVELAVCHLGLKDDEKAMELFRTAERVNYEVDVVHNYQVVLANIGNVYLHRRDHFTAISYYSRALALAREIKDPVSVKKWTRNINLAYARVKLSVDQQKPRTA